jgi:hypothetical protein
VWQSVSKDLRSVINNGQGLLALTHHVPHGLGGMFVDCDPTESSQIPPLSLSLSLSENVLIC